jgi:hypothetical protein
MNDISMTRRAALTAGLLAAEDSPPRCVRATISEPSDQVACRVRRGGGTDVRLGCSPLPCLPGLASRS